MTFYGPFKPEDLSVLSGIVMGLDGQSTERSSMLRSAVERLKYFERAAASGELINAGTWKRLGPYSPPYEGGMVLIFRFDLGDDGLCYGEGAVSCGHYVRDNQPGGGHWVEAGKRVHVTHWMELPDSPLKGQRVG